MVSCFRLRTILLPTLISCCFDSQENKASMEQEISSTLLVSFIEVGYYYIDFFGTNLPHSPSYLLFLRDQLTTELERICFSFLAFLKPSNVPIKMRQISFYDITYIL